MTGSGKRGKLRVVIADDSRTARLALRRLVENGGHVVVAEADTGDGAVEAVAAGGVDLVLMDLVMPGDGLAAIGDIMATRPTPIVVISELIGAGARANFDAVQAGAVDALRKPGARELADPQFIARTLRRLEVMASTPVVRRRNRMSSGRVAVADASLPTPRRINRVCIGASTGGPTHVCALVKATLGAPWPTVVVQHMAAGFCEGMVAWLRGATRADVVLAEREQQLRAGRVYIAPTGYQATLRGTLLSVRLAGPGDRWCPSIDTLFRSAASDGFGAGTVGVLLTGMGDDGAAGMKALHAAGAWTCAQKPETCVVSSMPKAAIEAEAVSDVLSPRGIGRKLSYWAKAGAR